MPPLPMRVADHSVTSTAFDQSDYLRDDEEGFCAALSLAWCRRILDSIGGVWKEPKELPLRRLMALHLQAYILLDEQQEYLEQNKHLRYIMKRISNDKRTLRILHMGRDVRRRFKREGFIFKDVNVEGFEIEVLNDAKLESNLSKAKAKELRKKIEINNNFVDKQAFKFGKIGFDSPLLDLAQTLTVGISSMWGQPRFNDQEEAQAFVEKKIQAGRAHVLSMERFHATAVYRTTGFKSHDYYFFDPNYGEFRCQGADKAGAALYSLLQSYDNYRYLLVSQILAR